MKIIAAACLGAVAATFLSLPADAATYKCVAKDGSVTYQGQPCPDAGNEKQMRDPAAGPAGSAAPAKSALKEGWTAGDVTAMAESCAAATIGSAKRDFEAAAKAQGTKPEFPEAELASGVTAMCSCFAKRVGATHTRDDFQANRQAILKKMNDEAVAGGACKPEGLLGEVMEKSRQK
jgi:hypothetical protein